MSTSLAAMASGLNSCRHAMVALIMLNALFTSWPRAREYLLSSIVTLFQRGERKGASPEARVVDPGGNGASGLQRERMSTAERL
jgi:hypothetical protein